MIVNNSRPTQDKCLAYSALPASLLIDHSNWITKLTEHFQYYKDGGMINELYWLLTRVAQCIKYNKTCAYFT